MRAFAVIVCMWLGACANASQVHLPLLLQTKMAPSQIEAVKTGVRSSLKDPDSAKFGDMVAGREQLTSKDLMVCGYVNSKNGFGGYTGQEIFMAQLQADGAYKFIGMDIAGICDMQGLSVTGLRAS